MNSLSFKYKTLDVSNEHIVNKAVPIMGRPKKLSALLLTIATLFFGATSVYAAAPSLGTAGSFTVLGRSAVTCTSGTVVGPVAVVPGGAYTNTGCVVDGPVPPSTDSSATLANDDFVNAYTQLQDQVANCTTLPSSTLAGENIAPGVYCLDAVAKTGLLTLTGPADGEWIFLINGAFTATSFAVEMAGGGLPCNVYWAPTAAVTLTTSSVKGHILAGDPVSGSITMTGGTLGGQALANVAVTMTTSSVIGCGALGGTTIPPGEDPAACKKHNHSHKNKNHDDD